MKAKRTQASENSLLVGLDLGTTKTACLVAQVEADGRLGVRGVGLAPSTGMRRGVVVDIAATADSIRQAVGEAERMAGVKVGFAHVGVGGDHLKGITSHGVIAVSRKDNEIEHADVQRVLDAARAVAIPQDRSVLHTLAQEYIIDSQNGIHHPEGMSGVRLEAVVQIVTGAATSVQNVLKSCQSAGLQVGNLVPQPLASSLAVLTDDERELGVCMLDIGGGTCGISVFREGGLRHTGVVPLGGLACTRDLAVGLATPNEEAERLKRAHGVALAGLVPEGDRLSVPGMGGRPAREVERQLLARILQPRMEEILLLVQEQLKSNGILLPMPGGLVLTGGASLLPGACELAEQVLGGSARLGRPSPLGGVGEVAAGPEFATAVGLVLHALEEGAESGATSAGGPEFAAPAPGVGFGDWIKRLFKDYF